MILFTPGTTVTLAVTAASASIAEPAGSQICIQNLGTSTAFVVFGNSAVVATAAGFPIQPGLVYGLTSPGNSTHVAAICASGTTTLAITGGYGV